MAPEGLRQQSIWCAPPSFYYASILISVTFFCNFYLGLIHDARLYAFLAALDRAPAAFAADLFAGNEAQRSFDLFASLFAGLIEAVGLSVASKALVAAGLLLWLSGAAHLACRLFRSRVLRLGATLAAVSAFLPYSLFSVLESFATPRLFAEAVGLHAVALAIAGRPVAGVAVAIGAAAFHPLMAPVCLGVIVLWAARSDRRWLLTIPLGAGAAMGLAAAGLGPFATLGQTMDAAWLAIVQARNAFVFPALWSDGYWSAVIVQGAVLVAVLLMRPGGAAGAFYALSLGVGTTGLVANSIGADLLRDVFMIQTQQARALWLTSVAAHMAAAHGVWLIGRRGAHPVALLSGWAAWAVSAALLPPALNGALAVGLIALTRADLAPDRTPILSGAPGRVVMRALLVLGLGGLAAFAIVATYLAATVPDMTVAIVRALYVVSLASPVVAWVLLRRVRRPPARLAVAGLCLAASAATWDQRDAWTRHVETGTPPPAVLAALPEGRPVYWPGYIEAVWFLVQRPSYVSFEQGSGVLFDRAMAQEFARRLDQVRALEPRATLDYWAPYARDAVLRPVTAADVRAVCRRATPLKAIILVHELPALSPLAWTLDAPLPVPKKPDTEARQDVDTVYVYDCDRL